MHVLFNNTTADAHAVFYFNFGHHARWHTGVGTRWLAQGHLSAGMLTKACFINPLLTTGK